GSIETRTNGKPARDIAMKAIAAHAQLIADINDRALPAGRVGLWWLGQHSFIAKAGDTILYMDPFLTPMPERLVLPLLQPDEIRHAAIICGTHDHADHIDRPVWPALAAASPQARFVVPDLLRERLSRELSIPLSRLIGLDDGVSVEVGGVRMTGIAAAHEFL